MNGKILKEKDFHDQRFTKEVRQTAWKFYSIDKSSKAYFADLVGKKISGSRVLEIGCGKNPYIRNYIDKIEKGTGIDISEVAVNFNKNSLQRKDESNKLEFCVMNAEELNFPSHSFDLIIGLAIIHHLDIEQFLNNCSRVLDKNGVAIFIEPLGYNFLINLYRKFTPNLRTEDEHPLQKKDLELLKRYFHITHIKFFHLSTLFTVPFRNLKIFSILLKITELLDNLILKLPLIRWQAWQIVLYLEKPRQQV